MSRFQMAVLVPLLLLTFTVGIYDYRLFNMRVLGIQVWAHGEYEEGDLESWDPVVTITTHPLKEKIVGYLNQSIQGKQEDLVGSRGRRIFIFDPEVVAFFGQYYVSTWCGTCRMEMSPCFIDGNAYYYVLVYYVRLQPSLLETGLACAVSIATAVLWFVCWPYVSKFKPELSSEAESGVSQRSTAIWVLMAIYGSAAWSV